MNNKDTWQQCESKIFWNDVAPNEHVVQIYDNDTMLLNTLADYASNGFHSGDAVVIIATGKHITALNTRLKVRGLNLNPLIAAGQYIALDADETLAKFMVNEKPDEGKFNEAMTAIIQRAGKNGRGIRAFGEMVALLWERGNATGTMALEQVWNKFCAIHKFSLFCAYPKNGFGHNAGNAVMHICSAHSKMIRANEKFPSHIDYKETEFKAVI